MEGWGERSAASAIRQSGQSRQALQAARLSGGVEERARVGIAHVRQVPRIAHDTWPCARSLAKRHLSLFSVFISLAKRTCAAVKSQRRGQRRAAPQVFFFFFFPGRVRKGGGGGTSRASSFSSLNGGKCPSCTHKDAPPAPVGRLRRYASNKLPRARVPRADAVSARRASLRSRDVLGRSSGDSLRGAPVDSAALLLATLCCLSSRAPLSNEMHVG